MFGERAEVAYVQDPRWEERGGGGEGGGEACVTHSSVGDIM